jgi:hypothetical protein
MLTGRQVFRGETVAHVLASVLKDEPDWSALPVDTPAPIRKLLRRCLEKDRKRRIDSATVARLDIDEALIAPSVAERVAASSTSSAPRERLVWMAALAVAVLGMIALAVPALRYLRETSPPETSLEIATPTTGDPTSFALSPDGHQIVFVASGDGVPRLWVRSLATTTAQPLAGTEGANAPFWSPDSRSVGFFASGQLKRIELGGGAPLTVATAASGRGGTWNADGVILFAPTQAGPLFRVAASGGQAVAVTTLDRQRSHRWPVFLPDGRHFLLFAIGSPDRR